MLRLKQHARLWLAAFAAFIPVVRTIINRINPPARRRHFFDHLPVNGLQVILGHHAPANARLIGNHHHPEACLFQPAQRLARTGKPFEFRPVTHIIRARRLFIQDAVPI